MTKVKIVFVETNCKKNGPIKQTLNIINYMDRKIFEPILVTIWPEELNNSMLDEYRNANIPIYSLSISKRKSVLFGKYNITKILDEINPDIVQGVGMPPYRMTLGYKNTHHFITLRNYCYEDYPDYYGKVIGKIMAYLDIKLIKKRVKNGDSFITCSKSLTDKYMDLQRIKFEYIQNGVEIEKYRKRDLNNIKTLRKELNLPKDKILFIYSGGFIDRKNQMESIRAFLKMNRRTKAALILLGDGKNFEVLKSQFSEYKDIIFAGKVSNVEKYLHASDVYLSSSKSEGLPNGVLEAMACGLPIILSDIPQHMEIIDNDYMCGYSYSLGNINELCSVMDKIIDDDLNTMGNNAYKCVIDNFTAKGMSYKYQNLYFNIMSNKGELK